MSAMKELLHIMTLLPVAGFAASLFIPKKNEKALSGLVFGVTGINLIVFLVFTGIWALSAGDPINIKDLSLFSSGNYDFVLDFYFDAISAVFMFTGYFLIFLVSIYSRYYLHREAGYKRFFNTMLLFYAGFNVTVLSGNFETLFIGWEMLGLSSYLLIAFYRERYLPVKNALKVFTIYRIGDVGLILAMWMSHHMWHENLTFMKLNNFSLVHEFIMSHTKEGAVISFMILIAAAAKSAQLPFTSWLPRAMEGPTPSSAIFYGSLSVHIGAFLLLRTFPLWGEQVSVRIAIAALGMATALIASTIARVQSTVKSQIAYASAAQIGLIFVEIAAGLHIVALIHFTSNAFLRSYQLLVSPSVVTYLIKEQFYGLRRKRTPADNSFIRKIKNTVYLLSLKEWHLDNIIFILFLSPLKKMRRLLNFLTLRNIIYIFLPLYLAGLFYAHSGSAIPANIRAYLPALISFISLLMAAKSYNERNSAALALLLVVASHLLTDLAVSFNAAFEMRQNIVYLSGVFLSGTVAWLALRRLCRLENRRFDLNGFYGNVYEHPKLALLFLLACLGLAGFPITSTFIGEDLVFTHIRENQVILASLISISLIINGVALIRIYTRLFLGPHFKDTHEKANHSS